MSLILAEGADLTAALLDPRVNIATHASHAVVAGAGRRGGGAIALRHTTGMQVYGLKDDARTYTLGFAHMLETMPAGSFDIVLYANTSSFTVRLFSDGSVNTAVLGTWGTASAAGLVSVGVWRYFELVFKMADSGGLAEVWVDGTRIQQFSGDTRWSNTTFTTQPYFTIQGMSATATSEVFVDDIYLLDDAGTVNNARLGDVAVVGISPNGNGTHSQLVGSDGNSVDNYALVADDDDATYVEGDADDEQDTYAMADLPFTGGTVHGVVLNHRTTRSEQGYRKVRTVRKLGATEAHGPEFIPGYGAYSSNAELLETDPDGNPWSISNVNAAEFGVQARPFVAA